MNGEALQRAQERIERAASTRVAPAELDAALERARDQVAALAATTAELEASMPGRVGDAVKDGIRTEVLPVARHIAEVRGLLNQLIRRIEGISLLVDLIAAGFQGVEQRLDRIEAKLGGDLVALPLAS
jgi:hypothetical protein